MESLEVLYTANINIRGARCSLTTGKFHGASGTSHDFLCFSSPINLTHAEVAHQTKHLWESSTIVVIDMPSHIKLEDSAPSDDINPYVILGIEKSATEAEIRTAYKKLALVQHPDKVNEAERPAAHIAFQVLAHAYAILSDKNLRKRYDTIGNTSLSEVSDFNWHDFYADQYADVVTPDTIAGFAKHYKGSIEERRDILEAYKMYSGSMSRIYETVLLSDPIEDEDRFRIIIEEAIANGDVPDYAEFAMLPERQKEKRIAKARKERANFEKTHKKYGQGNSLQALMLQRHKDRSGALLEQMEAKYGGTSSGKKRKAPSEPPEEAFAATASRARKTRASAAKEEVEDEEEEEDDEEEDDGDDYEEEEKPKAKSQGKKKAAPRKGNGRKKNPNYGNKW